MIHNLANYLEGSLLYACLIKKRWVIRKSSWCTIVLSLFLSKPLKNIIEWLRICMSMYVTCCSLVNHFNSHNVVFGTMPPIFQETSKGVLDVYCMSSNVHPYLWTVLNIESLYDPTVNMYTTPPCIALVVWFLSHIQGGVFTPPGGVILSAPRILSLPRHLLYPTPGPAWPQQRSSDLSHYPHPFLAPVPGVRDRPGGRYRWR